MTESSVELNVQVSMLTGVRKRDPSETAFVYPPPAPATFGHRAEYDENYVAVQLKHRQEGNFDVVLNMLLSKESAKKLNLMAGDHLTIKLTKT